MKAGLHSGLKIVPVPGQRFIEADEVVFGLCVGGGRHKELCETALFRAVTYAHHLSR